MRVRLGRGSIRDIGAGARDAGQYDRSVTVDACAGFAMLARRDAIERTGGFDDAYNPYGWEEVDFSLRVRVTEYERGKAAKWLGFLAAVPVRDGDWRVLLAHARGLVEGILGGRDALK